MHGLTKFTCQVALCISISCTGSQQLTSIFWDVLYCDGNWKYITWLMLLLGCCLFYHYCLKCRNCEKIAPVRVKIFRTRKLQKNFVWKIGQIYHWEKWLKHENNNLIFNRFNKTVVHCFFLKVYFLSVQIMKNHVHENISLALFIAKNILMIVGVCNLNVIDDVTLKSPVGFQHWSRNSKIAGLLLLNSWIK